MSTPRFNPNKTAPAVGAFLKPSPDPVPATSDEPLKTSNNNFTSGNVITPETNSNYEPVNTSTSASVYGSENTSVIKSKDLTKAGLPKQKKEKASTSASEYGSVSVSGSENKNTSLNDFLSKAAGPKFEETHTKTNVWIENDLLLIIEKIQKKAKPGIKKTIFNEALKMYLRANKLLD